MGFQAEESWSVDDVPESFVMQLSKAIVGIEISITRIEGKSKVGQELAPLDQVGCIRGFRAMGTEAVRELAGQIEEGMRKDMMGKNGSKSRADVLEEESKKGLVLGKEVKGRFGWYYTAVPSVRMRPWGELVVIALCMAIGLGMVWKAYELAFATQ